MKNHRYKSEITLDETLTNVLSIFAPIKIIYNGNVIYNDFDPESGVEKQYDSDGDVVYGELYHPARVVRERAAKWLSDIVTSVHYEIVDFHHSIITIEGDSID